MWRIVFTKKAREDAKKISSANLKGKAQKILNILETDPFTNPPSFEKLKGDLTGAFSRRINIKHRLVYQVIEEIKTVKVIRMWSHYD